MNRITAKTRAALDKYKMIENGDKIAVGVSGGKDSLILIKSLSEIRAYYPKNFEIIAITIDPCFNDLECDYTKITDFCLSLGIRHVIKRTNLSSIIFNERKEKNPCSLCARMRRGMLHNISLEHGCSRIALGHHFNDAAETFLMNLLNGGAISCFSPVSYLSIKKLWLIRPLIFCEESLLRSVSVKNNLPVCKSLCPVDGKTERQKTKELIKRLEKDYPDLRKKIVGAMQRGKISNW